VVRTPPRGSHSSRPTRPCKPASLVEATIARELAVSDGVSTAGAEAKSEVPGCQDASRFKHFVSRLSAWCQAHGGELPRQVGKNGDPEEQQLARFLNDQQTACAHGALHEERKQQLRSIPGMEARFAKWDPIALTKEDFEDWVSRLRAWAVEHGRLPEYAKGDAVERRLGSFLNKQRGHLETKSALGQERLQFLEAAGIPGLRERIERWRHPRCAFEERIADLQAWVAKHKGLPRTRAQEPEERRLANFLRKQHDVFKKGVEVDAALRLERRRELLLTVPGLEGKFGDPTCVERPKKRLKT